MVGELGEMRKYVYEDEKKVERGMLILNMVWLRVFRMMAKYRMLLFGDPIMVI